jgi:hypothetical protein
MSDYNFVISNVEFNVTNGLYVSCTVTGSPFPEPTSNTLSLANGVLTGSFGSSSNSNMVSSFTFMYSNDTELSAVSLDFSDYPVDYSGVNLVAAVNMDLGDDDFELLKLEAKSKPSGKKLSTRLRRKSAATDEGGKSIASFVDDTVSHAGAQREAGDMEIVDSQFDDLQAECTDNIDFNNLSEPLLICWHSDTKTDEHHVLGEISITDNQ